MSEKPTGTSSRAEKPQDAPNGGGGTPTLTPDEYRALGAQAMPEKTLQELVRRLAVVTGWEYYHPWTSKHSPAGYPDCTMTRAGRIVWAELKAEGKRPTRRQEAWLAALRLVPGAEVYVWTPAHWLAGDIERVLREEEGPRRP